MVGHIPESIMPILKSLINNEGSIPLVPNTGGIGAIYKKDFLVAPNILIVILPSIILVVGFYICKKVLVGNC